MAKVFKFKGKTIEEIKQMGTAEFAGLLPARRRRSIERGLTEEQKKCLAKIEKFSRGERKKPVKTHCRDLVILPSMIGVIVQIHNGKDFIPVTINEEMLGYCLGDFVMTTRPVKHSGPGVGATRSSKHISVK